VRGLADLEAPLRDLRDRHEHGHRRAPLERRRGPSFFHAALVLRDRDAERGGDALELRRQAAGTARSSRAPAMLDVMSLGQIGGRDLARLGDGGVSPFTTV
jgi:hypothetical protein